MSALNELEAQGQAVWLDFVDRKFLAEGGLTKLVDEDGITGVTSNPSIFEKAMGHGDAYDDELAAFDKDNADASTMSRYEASCDPGHSDDGGYAEADLRQAGRQGRLCQPGGLAVSRERYRCDDRGSAQAVGDAVDKPNLMIKIPGTAGRRACDQRRRSPAGINVNVTLLFALDAYVNASPKPMRRVWKSECGQGQAIDRIASVASFFVSRIDTMVDKEIDRPRRRTTMPESRCAQSAMRGKVAIANAKMAYQWFLDFEKSERWQALAAKGAMPQRSVVGVDGG